jgi:hypothetical protein
MVSDRQKRAILKTCVVSFIVYAVFNLLAMLLYPGGTSFDKDAEIS